MARSGGVGNNYTHQRERVAIAICKDVRIERQERDLKASSTWHARAAVPQISCSDLQVFKIPAGCARINSREVKPARKRPSTGRPHSQWGNDCSGKYKVDVTCAEDSCYGRGMACSSRATGFVEACGQGFAVPNERLP